MLIQTKNFSVNHHLHNIPQPVGWDSRVQFSLSNFLNDILQQRSSKCHLRQFKSYVLILNVSFGHIFELSL